MILLNPFSLATWRADRIPQSSDIRVEQVPMFLTKPPL
jgi:hypothetical protein